MKFAQDIVLAPVITCLLYTSTGMHCLGCMASHGETVEEACAVHGVDPDALVAELNDYFAHL